MDISEQEKFREKLNKFMKENCKSRDYYVVALFPEEVSNHSFPRVFLAVITSMWPNPRFLQYKAVVSSLVSHSEALMLDFGLSRMSPQFPVERKP